jgi:transcriptional regulator of arginine metabolism
MTKAQRQHRIAQLIADGPIASQSELVELLAADGVAATQATVSRDLVELGAVKVRGQDGTRTFALTTAARPSTTEEQLRRVLSEWVVDVACAGPLIVVKTPPGCAHVVASALDRGALQAVLGTVAGDDTIFAAVDDRIGGEVVADQVRALAGLDRPAVTMSSRGARRARGAATKAVRATKTTKRGR